MFTTASLIASLRTALDWARAWMATSHFAPRPALARVVGFDPCRVPAPVPIPVPRRPRTLAAVTASALATAALLSGSAQSASFDMVADGRLVDVQVQVEGRGTVPLYFAPNRFDRRYFQAFQGRNYSLVLHNNSGRRVGVLIAVDGLNVVTGQRSSLSRHESMYVLDPHERTVIRGWRTSLESVRKFVFVDERRSYAERTGQANGDMGWIRVLAFREQRAFWEPNGKIRDLRLDDEVEPYGATPELNQRRQASPETAKPEAEGLDAAPPKRMYADEQQSVPGTGWGEQRRDPVNRTRFTAEAHPVDQIVLRYEYASGLRALGIKIWNGRDRVWERERGELGFAQPPRW